MTTFVKERWKLVAYLAASAAVSAAVAARCTAGAPAALYVVVFVASSGGVAFLWGWIEFMRAVTRRQPRALPPWMRRTSA